MANDNLFEYVSTIDKMILDDALIDATRILILSTRDDVFKVKSSLAFRPVIYFDNYEFNDRHAKSMHKAGIDEVVLIPLDGYEQLAIKLINAGFSVKILNMRTNEILKSTSDALTKSISKSTKSYYDFSFDEFCINHSDSLLSNPALLENKVVELIESLNFQKIDHVSFDCWLNMMIGKQDAYYAPILFNMLKTAVIKTYNKIK